MDPVLQALNDEIERQFYSLNWTKSKDREKRIQRIKELQALFDKMIREQSNETEKEKE